jgi:hypothetical protein
MPDRVIEGIWEDVVLREDLRGRRVRVTVIEESVSAPAQDDQWVQRLRAWASNRSPVSRFVDDSREAIYEGTVDDPR